MKKLFFIIFLMGVLLFSNSYAADVEITSLDAETTIAADDLLLLTKGTGTSKKLAISTLINDIKGNGDTTYLWSADKIYDQLLLKQDALTNPLVQADVDDTPVNGVTTAPVSSNWAYDHENASDPHTGYMLESNIGFGANNYIKLAASPGTPDTTKFLRDDGTWVVPSGSGDVSKVGTPANYEFGIWTGDGTLKGLAVTGTKVMCTDANGQPIACTNLTDDADLATYAGITPSADIQTFLGYTNFAAMKAGLSVDDLITLSGVADGETHLSTFTGSTISDNGTIKAGMQELETAVETKAPITSATMTGAFTVPRFYGTALTSAPTPTEGAEYIADGNSWDPLFLKKTKTADTIAFIDSNPDTITDSGNGFITAGFIAGMHILPSGTVNNNTVYTIETVTAGTITLKASDTVTAEGAGSSFTLTGYRPYKVKYSTLAVYVGMDDYAGNLLISGLGSDINIKDTLDPTKLLSFDLTGNTTGKTTTLAFHSAVDETIDIYNSVNEDRLVASIGEKGGPVVTTGVKTIVSVPFNCTITDYQIITDTSSTTTVDVWKSSYANYDGGATHPVDADSITASAPLAITAATKGQDDTLTGWTVALTKGDILFFNVDANNNATKIQINLNVTKN